MNPCKTDPTSNISNSAASSSTSEFGFAIPVTIPVFGSTSPTSVRKLLSLSDRTRPLESKKRPLAPRPSPLNPPLPAVAAPSSRTAGWSEGSWQKRYQHPLRVAAVNLSEESSSVTSVQRPTKPQLYVAKRCEGPLEKVTQKFSTNGRTWKQLDSDSGHSSIASSGADSQSPLSSDPEQGQGLGITTDLGRHPQTAPILLSDRVPVFYTCHTAGSASPPTSGFHRYVCRPPMPPHQRISQIQTGPRNGVCPVPRNYPAALWNLEEPRTRQMWNNFRRRALSYDGSPEFSDLHSGNDWEPNGYEEDDVEELVSLV